MSDPKNPFAQDTLGAEEIASLLSSIDSLVATSQDPQAEAATPPSEPQPPKEESSYVQDFAQAQKEEIEKGIAADLAVDKYAKHCYNWMQMCEIRLGLQDNLNTEIYESPLYSASQMREIRLGLLDHLDVSSYATLVYSATDMQNIRKKLFARAYKDKPTGYGKTIKDDETGILVRISDDCMKAFLQVPDTLETVFTETDLMRVLENNEILHGIITDSVRMIAEESIHKEVCVAKGKPPIVGKSGRFELFFENGIEKGHTVPPEGSIDYTDVNIVELIKPGDTLVKYHPAQKDVQGITVTNIVVDGVTGEEMPPLKGVGFEYDPQKNLYTATQKGYASYNDTTSSLNVWQIYTVQGDVCYYQSLEYEGTVHVHGSLRSMSVIHAKGDVIIDGFLENASIYSEQNIVIKGGANGGLHGKIEAGGSVRGNFFENMDIKAGGLIEGNYFLNSTIFTDDRLVAHGKKARILGGEVTAAVGVEAVVIGNYMSKKTFFNVGDIYDLAKRIMLLDQSRETAAQEVEQLEQGRQKLLLLLGESNAEGNALYDRTNSALQAKKQLLAYYEHETARLNLVMKRAEKAYVHVHKEIQADVIFTINGVRKVTEKTISHGIFLTKTGAKKR